MKLLVVGASGGTGLLLAGQAAGHGHDVTAFVRDAADAPPASGRLRVVPGDVADSVALAAAVEGQDAVISVLAAGAGDVSRVLADGTANLVRAMTAKGVDRLVVASAAGLGGHVRELPLAYRAMLLLPPRRRDRDALEAMEGEVMLSDLDWTIVRAAMLSNGAQTGHYRVVEGPVVPRGLRLSRADLAALLLKVAEMGRYRGRIVAAAY